MATDLDTCTGRLIRLENTLVAFSSVLSILVLLVLIFTSIGASHFIVKNRSAKRFTAKYTELYKKVEGRHVISADCVDEDEEDVLCRR